MKVTPAGTYLGAVVEDFRLDANNAATGPTIQQLLNAYKVVMFRQQFLTPVEHRDVATTLGPVETHPFGSEDAPVIQGITPHCPHPGLPEVSAIHHTAERTGNLNAWHSDLNWRAKPTYISLLIARKLPPVGGDTIFADMARAYATLPSALRDELDGLRVVHDWMRIYQKSFAGRPELLAEMRERFPAQSHPLVLVHPVTQSKVLFSNKVSGERIEGASSPERAAELLDLVHRRAWLPEFHARFSWNVGDVLMWDNLAVQHYAVSDYSGHERLMERVTVSSDNVWPA